MANTLAAIYALASDETFKQKLRAAVMYVAVDVIKTTDNMSGPLTALDKQRRALAVKVIEHRDAYGEEFAWILATVPSITGSSSDENLLGAVNAAWNYLANTSH